MPVQSPIRPVRGEVWHADLEPVRGHEQGRQRPVVVVSADALNRSRAEMLIAVPTTTRWRRVPFHVPVEPPEGGLTATSFVLCDQVRAISVTRLLRRLGVVSPSTMADIEDRLRILFDL